MESTLWTQALQLAKEGKFEEALQLYDLASETHGFQPDLLNDKAVCLLHLQRASEAEQLMTRAIELQPDYGYRYAARAYVRVSLKNHRGAIEDYKKAIELDPEDAIALNNLGLLEEQLGYHKEAGERYRMADELMGILKDRGIVPEADVPPTQQEEREIEASQSSPQQVEDPTPTNRAEIIKGVFTSKKVFGEFLSFMRNGFKLGNK